MLIPEIEEDIPLPTTATELMPRLSPQEEIAMRGATLKLLSDLSGKPIQPDRESIEQAEILARAMIQDTSLKVDLTKYKNETLAFLAGMVQQYNAPLVEELAELKQYVINKLVHEVERAQTSRDRIAALSRLGEVDGVNAFNKRSEVTHKVKPMDEIEKELLQTINSMEYKNLMDQHQPEKKEEETT
jgi:hypothetical protein